MILIIDNYDSFTYNLYQFIGEINSNVLVYRNDEITIDEIKNLKLERIVISPGPGYPRNAGISKEVIRTFGKEIPILGVCLGHQAIGEVFGGKIVEAPKMYHGKTSIIEHNEKKLFKGINKSLQVMRYHSLIIDKSNFPDELEITASTKDNEIMGIKHKEYPVYGVQFHPESIMTNKGKTIIKNFLEI
ncbi:MAG: anthranilate synthase component II [Eubacteriaceae bacterium]